MLGTLSVKLNDNSAAVHNVNTCLRLCGLATLRLTLTFNLYEFDTAVKRKDAKPQRRKGELT